MTGLDEFERVLQRLVEAAGVPNEHQKGVMKSLRKLRRRYPTDTPAAIFHRGRRQGLPVPPSRCEHHVPRGQCVVCDRALGHRLHFTGGGTHVHSTPACPALVQGQRKVELRGGSCEPIEVLPLWSSAGRRRDPCKACLPGGIPAAPASSTNRRRGASRARRGAEQARGRVPKLRTLTRDESPSVGTTVTWNGYEGEVVGSSERGVHLSVPRIQLTIPWGERIKC